MASIMILMFFSISEDELYRMLEENSINAMEGVKKYDFPNLSEVFVIAEGKNNTYSTMSNVINHSDLVTIINDSMIDLDKLRAINKYVVDNGEYNYDSLATYVIEVKKIWCVYELHLYSLIIW